MREEDYDAMDDDERRAYREAAGLEDMPTGEVIDAARKARREGTPVPPRTQPEDPESK